MDSAVGNGGAAKFPTIRVCPCHFSFVAEGGANAVFAYRGGAKFTSTKNATTDVCEDPIPPLLRAITTVRGDAPLPSFLRGVVSALTIGGPEGEHDSAMSAEGSSGACGELVGQRGHNGGGGAEATECAGAGVGREHSGTAAVTLEGSGSEPEGYASSFVLRMSKRPLTSSSSPDFVGPAAEPAVARALAPYIGASVGPTVPLTCAGPPTRLPPTAAVEMVSAGTRLGEGSSAVVLAARICLDDFRTAVGGCSFAVSGGDHQQRKMSTDDGADSYAFSLMPNYAAPVGALLGAGGATSSEKSALHSCGFSAAAGAQHAARPPSLHFTLELKPKRVWMPPAEAVPFAIREGLRSVRSDAVGGESEGPASEAAKREDQLVERLSAAVLAEGDESFSPLLRALPPIAPVKFGRCRYSQMLSYKARKASSKKVEKKERAEEGPSKDTCTEGATHNGSASLATSSCAIATEADDALKKAKKAEKHRWGLHVGPAPSPVHVPLLRAAWSSAKSLPCNHEGCDDSRCFSYCPSLILPTPVSGGDVCRACPHCAAKNLSMLCPPADATAFSAAGVALSALLCSPSNNLTVISGSLPLLYPVAYSSVSPSLAARQESGSAEDRLAAMLSFVEAVVASDASALFTALAAVQCGGLEIGALMRARAALLSNICDPIASDAAGIGSSADFVKAGAVDDEGTSDILLKALEDGFYAAVTASDASVLLAVEEDWEGEGEGEGDEAEMWASPSLLSPLSPPVITNCGWSLRSSAACGAGALIRGYRADPSPTNSANTCSSRCQRFRLVAAVVDIDAKRAKPLSYYASQDEAIVGSC